MKNKKMFLALVFVLAILLITIGTTLAFFTYNATGDTLHTITTGGLTFHYKEISGKGQGISISDAVPVDNNNNEKSSNDYFEFRITSSVTNGIEVPYVVTARMNSDSDSILGNIIDMYLTEINGTEVPTRLYSGVLPKYNDLEDYENRGSYTEKVIYTDTVTTANYDKTFRLRMWIDQDADMAGNVQIKYFCNDIDVTDEFNNDSNYECSGGIKPSKTSIVGSDYNNKNFSITINVNAIGAKKSPGAKEVVLADEDVQVRTLTLNKSTEMLEQEETPENGVYEIDTNGHGYGGDTNNTKTYIFRGDVTDNVVEFAGKIWRIVRVNEDGTIRLILDTRISETPTIFNQNYNLVEYMYYTNAPAYNSELDNKNVKNQLEAWYDANIGNNEAYASKVAVGNYFCEEAKVMPNEGYITDNAVMEIQENYVPYLTCATDGNNHGLVYGTVGLLTYDEAIYAGVSNGIHGNRTFYLYKGVNGDNNYGWWTSSPAGLYRGWLDESRIWFIQGDGSSNSFPTYYDNSVRPVINLKADTVLKWNESTSRYVVQ